jgi:hypothetical protein
MSHTTARLIARTEDKEDPGSKSTQPYPMQIDGGRKEGWSNNGPRYELAHIPSSHTEERGKRRAQPSHISHSNALG